MHDPDEFDSAGFADYLHDAVTLVLICLLLLAVTSPWWMW